MPMKNRYNYNRQTIAFGGMFRIQPLGYMEVLPGETLNGRISVDSFSAPTKRNIQSRVYSDLYTFFVPFRLLWENWPMWIADNGVGGSCPTLNTLATWNFEGRLTDGATADGTVAATRNTVWQRRAYRLIFEKFFNKEDQWDQLGDAAKDTADYWTALVRPSTWEQAEPPGARPSQTIDTSGASVTVDQIREGFARDQWDKMRNFYGARYTDYMMALGVKTPWTLLDEPEVLGKKSGDWGFRLINNMSSPQGPQQQQDADNALANAAGYFHNKGIVNIKRKFIPEHGLVCAYSVARCDPYLQEPPQEVVLSKSQRADYWSPEFEMEKERKYNNNLITTGNLNKNVPRIPFDEYRRGMNTNVQEALAQTQKTMALTAGLVSDVGTPSQYDSDFVSDYFPTYGGNIQNHYQATAEWRVSRRSPLVRQGQSKPIR